MQGRKDFFQTINNFPHSVGIYLTFTLENEVIDKLAENSYANIIILHDYRQGVSLKNSWNNRISCIPINTFQPHQQNCFHSKLALLKSDDKAKLLLGSANLSKDSFTTEKEICFEIDLDFNSDLYRNIVLYIESLIPQTHSVTGILTNTIDKLKYSTDKNIKQKGLSFISNSSTFSVFDNFQGHIQKDKQPILKIASPYLSSDFKGEFENLIRNLNPKEVHLYLRNDYPVPSEMRDFPNLKIYQPKVRSLKKGFHAKIISIEYPTNEILYIGSANFSMQGFFLNLDQAANQECGIIINSKEKSILDDWFNEGWEKPVTIKDRNEDENLLQEIEEVFELIPYAWAETNNTEETTLSFYLPNEDLFGKVYADGINLKLTSSNPNLGIYNCKFKPKGDKVLVKIGSNYSEEIIIFNEILFEQRAQENGDSLFFEPYPIDSVEPLKLREAVEKEGIKITTMGAIVVEPPYLEQFFYNVKDRITTLSKRNYFSEYHEKELSDLLNKLNGGEGIYLIAQLLKCFTEKKQFKLEEICKDRISTLLEETKGLTINNESFGKFFKKWREQ